MARNFRPGREYLPGVVVQRLGPLTFLVEVKDGLLWRRHVDHLKPLQESPSTESTSFSNEAEPEEAVDDDTHLPFTDSWSGQTNQHNNHNHLFIRGTDILNVITINLFGMVVQSLTSWSRNYEH